MTATNVLRNVTAAMTAMALSGCATQQQVVTSSVTTPALRLASDTPEVDCKELTGRMQVKILQARHNRAQDAPTGLSKALQSSFGSLFGAASQAASDTANQTDRTALEAGNDKLVTAGCASFDLDAELQQHDTKVTPAPTVPARQPGTAGKSV